MQSKTNQITVFFFLFLFGTSFLHGQTINYGFQQDPGNPYRMTAVAIPDFSSDNVTISTALFSFSIPEISRISPEVEDVPQSGHFEDHTGAWTVQKITPTVLDDYGFEAKGLEGNSLYQVVLQNSPVLNKVQAGVPIPLFSFEIVNDFQMGKLEVLQNDGAISDAIFSQIQSNFNNQISVSIDDAPAIDIYERRDPFSGMIPFPIKNQTAENLPAEVIRPHLTLQPNPTADFLRTTVQSQIRGTGNIFIFDAQQNEVLRQRAYLDVGHNVFSFELRDLPAGVYVLMVKVEDQILQRKFVKVRR